MVHIVSDKSFQRPGYKYDEHGVGHRVGVEPYINWKHIDGPLLWTSSGKLHWLTLWERIQHELGLTSMQALDEKHR